MINLMNNNVSPVEQIAKGASGAPARKSKGSTDFAEELSGAQAAAQNALVSQGAQKAPDAILNISAEAVKESLKDGKPAGQPAGEVSLAKDGLMGAAPKGEAASMKDLLSVPAESPLANLKAATSMNAGAAITGLKPWSRDWVFDGAERNPDLQTLIPEMAARNLKDSSTEESLSIPRARGEAAELMMPQLGSLDGTQSMRGMVNVAEDPVSQQLRDLNGAVTEMRESLGVSSDLGDLADESFDQGSLNSTRGPAKGAVKGATTSASLSGAEFLGALNAVRGRAEGNSGQFGGGDSQSQSQSMKNPNLRVIDGGGKGKKLSFDQNLDVSQLGNPAVAASGQPGGLQVNGAMKPVEVTGHVVQGAMARERLSSESVTGLSGGIRELSSQGGGEIRVRLRPDNLGEVHVKVVTQGNQVGLTIQATDEKAKKVIEESLSHLKDSLAGHRLTLGQVDVTTAPVLQQNASAGDHRDAQSQSQQAFGDMMGMDQGGNRNQSGGWDGDNASRGSDRAVPGVRAGAFSASGASGANRARVSSSSRLDVMA